MNVIGIIPARYQSSRFPGKMVASILGKTLIQRTYESAKKCTLLDKLIVATDDERIKAHVESFGGVAYMTDTACLNGTQRLIDAIKRYPELQQAEIYVNIQGDMPCIDPKAIEKAVQRLIDHPNDVLVTIVKKISDPSDLENRSVVKCVVNKYGHALYFSRLPIPGSKEAHRNFPYLKHMGLYVFRKNFLLEYGTLSDTPLQLHEDLEQLKVLEHGYPIAVVEVEDLGGHEVDLKEDIQKVERYLCSQNTFL